MNKLSIIIPVFNEEKEIPKLLNHLNRVTFYKKHQIIVIDGGSTDNTLNELSKFKNIEILSSQKGRAKQQNWGAKYAINNLLYFLHADSYPPLHFDKHIMDAFEKGFKFGCFKMKFNSHHPWLRLAGFFTKFNLSLCRGGDQSLYIQKDLFFNIGCFNEKFTIYEDNELIKRLYKIGRFKVIQKNIITSARKYNEYGVFKLQLFFWKIHLMHKMYKTPEKTNNFYLLNTSFQKK